MTQLENSDPEHLSPPEEDTQGTVFLLSGTPGSQFKHKVAELNQYFINLQMLLHVQIRTGTTSQI